VSERPIYLEVQGKGRPRLKKRIQIPDYHASWKEAPGRSLACGLIKRGTLPREENKDGEGGAGFVGGEKLRMDRRGSRGDTLLNAG